jgi:hypothetical protein
MSWKQQKVVSVLAIAAALLINCLPLDTARPSADTKVAAATP